MTPGHPRWRRGFDTAERAVGRPLEALVASPGYLDVALFGRRVRAAAGSAVTVPMTTVLHLLSLPARSDIRKLSRQVATLSNEVRVLAGQIDELRRPLPRPKPRKVAGDA